VMTSRLFCKGVYAASPEVPGRSCPVPATVHSSFGDPSWVTFDARDEPTRELSQGSILRVSSQTYQKILYYKKGNPQ